uniref:ATP-binding cassette sub-family B member 9-like isoform X1 n=1 Tax=Styela clava TaxID=7725 RepID=UPI001939D6FC|nr:ATP-binding cassette sub-family B member 9-like isoform X1 [Styela clava]
MGLGVLLLTGVFSLVDLAATSVILAHGNDWDLLLQQLRDKSVATTGLDFIIFAVVRSSLLIGALIGIIRNPTGGANKIEAAGNYVFSISIAIVLYIFAKLLVYSETQDFLNGYGTMWFWIIFGWSILAFGITIILFGKLSKHKPNTIEVDTNDTNVSEADENTPLLKSAINLPTNESEQQGPSSSDTSTSGYSDNEDNDADDNKKDKEDKKEKKKSFKELVSKVTITKMLSYSKKDVHLIFTAIVFLLGAALAETFIPLFTGRVISGIAIDQDTQKFTKNIIIMSLITIAASICAGCRGGLMSLAIARFNMRIRNHLFESLTKQEIGFFDTTKTGDMLSRLTSDTSTMSDMIGLNCNIFLRSVVKAVGTCVFMFSLSWRLTVVTFMGLPLVLGVSKLYGNYYKKLQTQVQDAYASANEVAEEVVSSMRTVRSFANESGENSRYEEKMLSVYKVQKKQAIAYAGFMWSTEIEVLALVTLTLWYGGHLVLGHLMKSENLISFILYQITLGGSMMQIGSVYTGLMQALGAAEKVFKLIDREPKIELKSGEHKPEQFEGQVSFEDVTFAYPSRPKQAVLKKVSFIAPPGQVTALVGPSGGGKSSCVNLLQHFYECVSGSIKIDGNPVEKYCHKYLHQKISLVGQEPVLYARSIKENIAYGMDDSEYTMEDVVAAARKANAHSFITELTEQYQTETGEKGTQLSGGQKQRVAIARALIRNPRILILDEATSALDTESEYLVQQALQETMKDRTVIVIAHRLSTVESADKIVVIDKGEVVEQGNHAELMKSSGMYYKLVHRQLHTNHSHKKRERSRTGSSASAKPASRSSSVSKSLIIPHDTIMPRSVSISSSVVSEKSALSSSPVSAKSFSSDSEDENSRLGRI